MQKMVTAIYFLPRHPVGPAYGEIKTVPHLFFLVPSFALAFFPIAEMGSSRLKRIATPSTIRLPVAGSCSIGLSLVLGS